MKNPTSRDFYALLPSLEVATGKKLKLLMQKSKHGGGSLFCIPSITNGFENPENAFRKISSLFQKLNCNA
jgi:hypothetical protein